MRTIVCHLYHWAVAFSKVMWKRTPKFRNFNQQPFAHCDHRLTAWFCLSWAEMGRFASSCTYGWVRLLLYMGSGLVYRCSLFHSVAKDEGGQLLRRNSPVLRAEVGGSVLHKASTFQYSLGSRTAEIHPPRQVAWLMSKSRESTCPPTKVTQSGPSQEQ